MLDVLYPWLNFGNILLSPPYLPLDNHQVNLSVEVLCPWLAVGNILLSLHFLPVDNVYDNLDVGIETPTYEDPEKHSVPPESDFLARHGHIWFKFGP